MIVFSWLFLCCNLGVGVFAGLLWFLLFAPSQLLKDLKASFFDFVFYFFFNFAIFQRRFLDKWGKT